MKIDNTHHNSKTVAMNETLPELPLKVVNVLKHGTKDGENRKPDTFILVTESGLEVVLAACISEGFFPFAVK